jgi:hypothetical protein
MSLGLVVLLVLVVLALGAIPRWRHSRSWGYGPAGILWVIVIAVLVLLLTHRMSW